MRTTTAGTATAEAVGEEEKAEEEEEEEQGEQEEQEEEEEAKVAWRSGSVRRTRQRRRTASRRVRTKIPETSSRTAPPPACKRHQEVRACVHVCVCVVVWWSRTRR
jgi:hypothetical protein